MRRTKQGKSENLSEQAETTAVDGGMRKWSLLKEPTKRRECQRVAPDTLNSSFKFGPLLRGDPFESLLGESIQTVRKEIRFTADQLVGRLTCIRASQ
jgi:hypothetical protein